MSDKYKNGKIYTYVCARGTIIATALGVFIKKSQLFRSKKLSEIFRGTIIATALPSVSSTSWWSFFIIC